MKNVEKSYSTEDILNLFKKFDKKLDKLKCFIEECCDKIPINVGDGVGLFKRLLRNKWEFKSIVPGTNITITEEEDTITINSTGGGDSFSCEDLNSCSTTNLPEGTNLYFTNPRAVSALTGQNISIFNNNVGYITEVTESPNRVAYFDNNGDLKTNSNFVYNETSNLFTAALPIPGGFYQLYSGASKIGVGDASLPDAYFQITPTALSWAVPLLSSDVFTLPYDDGNSGDVLTTNGAGNLTFQPIPTGFDCSDLIGCNISNLTNDSGYITSSALSPYLTSATAASTYVALSGSYSDPSWISSLSYSKLTGTPIIPSVTPSALTKRDDTNVTLTLSGTPTTSLLQPVELQLGWTGTLADSRIASAATWNAKQDALGYTPENISNKTDSVIGNETSSIKYLSVKGVYDWVISLGYITASALTGYATQAWVASQGYITNVITALGFTPENVANKSDSYTSSSSTTYSSSKALSDGLSTKFLPIIFLSNQFDPVNATNYFFGGISNLFPPSTTNTNQDFKIGYAATVVGCIIQAHGNTLQGTSEDVTLSLRNNTTNTTTTIGVFKTNATSTTTISTAITDVSIAVGANDDICLQINGTWATRPQGLRITGQLFVRI